MTDSSSENLCHHLSSPKAPIFYCTQALEGRVRNVIFVFKQFEVCVSVRGEASFSMAGRKHDLDQAGFELSFFFSKFHYQNKAKQNPPVLQGRN